MRRPGPEVFGLKSELTEEQQVGLRDEVTFFYFANPRFKGFPRVENEAVLAIHPLKPNPLPEDVKVLWLSALRSGGYEQGAAVLAKRRGAGDIWRYCCLGVLCEVQEIHSTILDGQNGDHKQYLDDNDQPGEEYLPPGMQELISDDAQKVLAHFNDSGWNFSQIAALIEAVF